MYVSTCSQILKYISTLYNFNVYIYINNNENIGYEFEGKVREQEERLE